MASNRIHSPKEGESIETATAGGNGHPDHGRVLNGSTARQGALLSNRSIVFLLLDMKSINRRPVQLELENLQRRARVLLMPLLGTSQVQASSSALPVLTPESSALAVLRSHSHYFWFSPRTYLRSLYLTARSAVNQADPKLFAIFMHAVHLARFVQRREIGHLHCACDLREALAGLIISELSGAGFSLAVSNENSTGEIPRQGLALSSFPESDVSSLEQVEGVRDELRELAARLFPEMSRSGVKVSFRGPTAFGRRTTRDYEVLFSSHSNELRKLLLKVHVQNRGTPISSKRDTVLDSYREFEMMNLLWVTFSRYSDRFYVPEPLQYFPDQSALLMENPRGDRLDQVLRWNRLFGSTSSRKKVTNQLHQVGEWLALFHWTTLRQERPDVVYLRLEQDFHRDLANCLELGLGQGLAQRIRSTFEKNRRLLFDNSQKIVAYHSAFLPPHIYIGKGRVTAVGFSEVKSGFVYEDIADFLIALGRYVDPGVSPRFARLLRERFLAGYQKYETLDTQLLDTCLVLKMLNVMARDREDLSKSPVPSLARLGYRNRAQLFSTWFENHLQERASVASA
jgi:hypothetical protein